jgi:type IV pilus assembly protein PilC
MGMFVYECMNKSGEVVRGQLNTEHEANAVAQLHKMGYAILELKEEKPSSLNSALQFGKKVNETELALFSRQFSAMLAAGIPVTRALFTLSKQVNNQMLKEALADVAQNVEGGMNLTEALSAYPKIFSPLYISMINSGEMGGHLDNSLKRLSIQLQKDKVLKDNIRSATFYPRMVLGFALLLLIGMLVFLVPVFMNYFPKDAELPLPTRMIMGLSNSVRGYWYIWILSIFIIVFAIYAYIRSSSGKNTWDRIKFGMPAFGQLIHKSVMARFCRTLSSLLDCGIPVIQALESAGPTSGSIQVAEIIKNASARIQEGKGIAEELNENKIFPPMVVQMISVGEETGSLPHLLSQIAEFYEEEVTIMSKGLTALIEPIMLVTVGILVGAMLIALYLPIFTVVTKVGS